MQVDPGAISPPQVSVLVKKSVGLVPLRANPETTSGAPPLFVTFTYCGALIVPRATGEPVEPKLSEVGLGVALAALSSTETLSAPGLATGGGTGDCVFYASATTSAALPA